MLRLAFLFVTYGGLWLSAPGDKLHGIGENSVMAPYPVHFLGG